MRRRAFAILPLVPLVLALAGCEIGALTGRATDEWTRTYQLSPGTAFELGNTNGKVDVEGVGGTTVEVRAERIARATTDAAARELLPKIKIIEKITRDRIVVETERMPGLMIGAGTEVRYHVKAPRTAAVTVQTTNGGITLKGLVGRTDAITTNGGITGDGLGGALHARTTNGGVRIELASAGTEKVEISTTNGGVRVAVPESTKADLTATCTNGGIDVSGLKLVVKEQSRRRLDGKLNGGGAPIDLHTVNGSIRIRALGAAVDTDEKH